MFTEASGVLHTATAQLGGGGVYFKQVTVVVPAHWDQSYCAAKIGSPGRGLAYKVNIPLFHYEIILQSTVKYFYTTFIYRAAECRAIITISGPSSIFP